MLFSMIFLLLWDLRLGLWLEDKIETIIDHKIVTKEIYHLHNRMLRYRVIVGKVYLLLYNIILLLY